MSIQAEMIERVKQLCQADANVEAALMYGSFTRGEGDHYSDIEFFIFVEDSKLSRLDQARWVAQVSPVAIYFKNEFGVGSAIFHNLIRGEFHFEPASEMKQVGEWGRLSGFPPAASMLIKDRNGELEPFLSEISGAGPDRTSAASVSGLWNGFLNWMLFAHNVMRRGEHARCLELFGYVQRHLLWMARLLEGKTEHWPTPAKAAEQDLSPAAYRRYRGCTASLNQMSLQPAFLASWGWGIEMGRQLETRFQLQFQPELVDRLNQRFWSAGEGAGPVVIETERLFLRAAAQSDAPFFLRLWQNPRVMNNVGFPNGLPITLSDVETGLAAGPNSPIGRRMVQVRKADNVPMGECNMGQFNQDLVCATDVKLLPEYWGNRYGQETKRAMVNYLFSQTDCQVVEATPSRDNQASIRMQEAVGGVKVGEGVWEVPPERAAYARPVHYVKYHVRRAAWLADNPY